MRFEEFHTIPVWNKYGIQQIFLQSVDFIWVFESLAEKKE